MHWLYKVVRNGVITHAAVLINLMVKAEPTLLAGFKLLICVNTSISVIGLRKIDDGFEVINESESKLHVAVGRSIFDAILKPISEKYEFNDSLMLFKPVISLSSICSLGISVGCLLLRWIVLWISFQSEAALCLALAIFSQKYCFLYSNFFQVSKSISVFFVCNSICVTTT